jgi:serine/threonine protein kinase
MADTLAPGFLLNNRYEILDLAGSGGMGAVYKAADTTLGSRLVAVKEMSEEGLSLQEVIEARADFRREAHLLASLHHPGLPGIHDYFTAGGHWYLVMDFIEGETLQDLLQSTGAPGLPVDEVLYLADQICAVLEYLHATAPPIIFRDLKPSNIMVTATGEVYLIDFGIARIFKPGGSRDTAALGTEGYAPPEQHGKAQTTVRSDIYSFGVVLHQLLTGIDPTVKPFTFPAIRPLNPVTPPQLETLIMEMVQMDDSRRPSSIAMVQQVLEQIGHYSLDTRSVIRIRHVSQRAVRFPPQSTSPMVPYAPSQLVVAPGTGSRRRFVTHPWILVFSVIVFPAFAVPFFHGMFARTNVPPYGSLQPYVGLFGLLDIIALVLWIVVLVMAIRLKRWEWLVCLFLFPFLSWIIFGFNGPTERAQKNSMIVT